MADPAASARVGTVDPRPGSPAPATIWREGARIRATNGMGYADVVTDEEIRGHLARPAVLGGEQMAAFARAVLAIREYERLASAPRPSH